MAKHRGRILTRYNIILEKADVRRIDKLRGDTLSRSEAIRHLIQSALDDRKLTVYRYDSVAMLQIQRSQALLANCQARMRR